MADARASILGRLRAAGAEAPLPPPDTAVMARRRWNPVERVTRLRQCMELVHTEFLEASPSTWPSVIKGFCVKEGLTNLLFGPHSDAGRDLAAAWGEGGPVLAPYDQPVEAFKETLFHQIQAGFTGSLAGVAETGGILLEPGPGEPRLLSLVPPIHIALLRAATIKDSLWWAIRELGWGERIPPNALLISGPSKTADIEMNVVTGVHGPNVVKTFGLS